MNDPFHHHPELRDVIRDPKDSFFRDLDPEGLRATLKERGLRHDWINVEAAESGRAEALEGRLGQDLWVFAYGSLMWDPAIEYVEVRRARVADYARRFIVLDVYGARGDADNPGLMAALDQGPGCEGLAFRIPAEKVENETRQLWTRERLAPAYTETFLKAETAQGPIDVLTFVADHAAELIAPALTQDEQAKYLATGSGFLGTSYEYIKNLADQFEVIGVEDPDMIALLAATQTKMKDLP